MVNSVDHNQRPLSVAFDFGLVYTVSQSPLIAH